MSGLLLAEVVRGLHPGIFAEDVAHQEARVVLHFLSRLVTGIGL